MFAEIEEIQIKNQEFKEELVKMNQIEQKVEKLEKETRRDNIILKDLEIGIES